MKLKDYIVGRRVVLHSPHPKSDVERRINRGTASMFSFSTHGVTGGVYFGRVRLVWSIPFFSNGFRPALSGRLTENMGRTELKARYGAPSFLLAFYALWYGGLLLMFFAGLAAILSDEPRTGNEWLPLVMLPIFAAIPALFHFIFNRNADTHFEEMLDLLKREADLC